MTEPSALELSDDEIRERVTGLETTRWLEEDKAWEGLRELGPRVVPFLIEAYPRMKKWQGRLSVIYHLMRYVRDHEPVFELGLSALEDRSTMVRYRACMMLAYALDKRAVPQLKRLLKHSDKRTVEDAKAALDAIRYNNHNYFVDRKHTGQVFWRIE